MNLYLRRVNYIKNYTIRNFASCLKKVTVLGIETSCDDTAVGIVDSNRKILAESKFNQWEIHKKEGHAKTKNDLQNSWRGGVIPHLARRLHRENLIWAVR
jgi:N6-L-threonylcarbamoyladenine synthase